MLAQRIVGELGRRKSRLRCGHDSSTNALIRRYRAQTGHANPETARRTVPHRTPARRSFDPRQHRLGVTHATRNDRTWPDGRQHGAPADRRRAQLRRLRPGRRTPCRTSSGRRRPAPSSLADFAAKLAAPRADLADGARRGRRQDARGPAAASRGGRHRDRRRQLELRRRHPPRGGARGQGHPLRRRRHERRRVGSRARLLHDDRRRGGHRAASRSDLRAARAGNRRHRAHAGPCRRRGGTAEQGYLHCGAERRRATSSRWSTTASSTA